MLSHVNPDSSREVACFKVMNEIGQGVGGDGRADGIVVECMQESDAATQSAASSLVGSEKGISELGWKPSRQVPEVVSSAQEAVPRWIGLQRSRDYERNCECAEVADLALPKFLEAANMLQERVAERREDVERWLTEKHRVVRMLFFRPRREGFVSRKHLEERVRLFQGGQWLQFLEQSQANDFQDHPVSTRRRRRPTDSGHEGGTSHGCNLGSCVALEGAEVVCGTQAMLRELSNFERRFLFTRHEVIRQVADSRPALPRTRRCRVSGVGSTSACV